MALESLTELTFSHQSDVWSFGVVLWETFSLGKSPYSGVLSVHQLISQLISGYRLKEPDYMPNKISQLMTECWKVDPNARPSFQQLEDKLSDLLDVSVRSDFRNQSDNYIAMMNLSKGGNNRKVHYINVPDPVVAFSRDSLSVQYVAANTINLNCISTVVAHHISNRNWFIVFLILNSVLLFILFRHIILITCKY